MKKKFAIIALVLLVIAICCTVRFLTMKKICLVCDESWEMLYPQNAAAKLRNSLLENGYRFKKIKIASTTLANRDLLMQQTDKINGNIIVYTPAVAFGIYYYRIQLPDTENKNSKVFAIFSTLNPAFDTILVSDPFEAWKKAALQYSGKIGILCYEQDLQKVQNFIDRIPEKEFIIYRHSSVSAKVNELKEQIQKETEVLFAYNIEDLPLFLDENSNVVCDYRISHFPNKVKNQKIIYPDLASVLIEAAKENTDESKAELSLSYEIE